MYVHTYLQTQCLKGYPVVASERVNECNVSALPEDASSLDRLCGIEFVRGLSHGVAVVLNRLRVQVQ